MTIIGRKNEKNLLNKAYLSKEAEFIVVYGRRRVGKTYLIREFYEKKNCLFVHATGEIKGKMHDQIKRFAESLSKTFFDNAPLQLSSWEEAFKLLEQQIHKYADKKVVIFLDELPWLATRRAGLLEIIDYYWNHHWSKLKNIILIACGSSASWLIKNIIYNKGGLHNRITCEINLKPFTLSETREFLAYRQIQLSNRHILNLYMALGGVPYYLKYIEKGLSAEQNIQKIMFDMNAPLKDEFNKLFQSLFKNANAYIEIIILLSKTKLGLSRSDIDIKTKLSTNGGRLTERLRDLCSAGFIEERVSWHKKNGEYYKLIDEFSLFYLYWIKTYKNKKFLRNHWLAQSDTQSYKSWAGYAFECICMKHVNNIVDTLNIKSGGIVDSWRFVPRESLEDGVQIDLLIDRADNAITICEIKFSSAPFSIDKQYFKILQRKIDVFKEKTKTNKQVFLTIISAEGLKKNSYSNELIDSVVTLEDLYKDI